MTAERAVTPAAARATELTTSASRDMHTLRALHVARGTRSGAAVLGTLLTIFWLTQSFALNGGAAVSWRIVAPLMLAVALGSAFVALRPFNGKQSLRRVSLDGSALAVAASVVISLASATTVGRGSAIHLASIILMLGYAMFVPAPFRIGVATLIAMAFALPVTAVAAGVAAPLDVHFAATIADLAGGFAVALCILSTQSVLFKRRYALLAEVSLLAEIDGLTGALNRRALLSRISTEFERARRYGGSLGMLVFDVDAFKRFNVEHGYHVGDRMLVELARTLDGVLRVRNQVVRGGCVGRYGGEEFVMLLPGVDEASLATVAEEARAALSSLRVPVDGEFHQLTVSVGSVIASAGGSTTAAEMLAQADEALYRAKAAGGNRVDAASGTTARGAFRSLFEDRLIAPQFSIPPAPALVERDRLTMHTALLRWIAVMGAAWAIAYTVTDFTVFFGLGVEIPIALGVFARGATAGGVVLVAARLWNSEVDRFVPALHHLGVILLSLAIMAWMAASHGHIDTYFVSLVFPMSTLAFALASSPAAIMATCGVIIAMYIVTMAVFDPGNLPLSELVLRTSALFAISLAVIAARAVTLQRRDEELAAREALALLARIDPLTGLPNRRSFDSRIEREVARLQDLTESLSVILIDLDHFKEINDSFGHLAGDAAIAAAGARITSALRASDAAARLGGEEFAVLLPHTDAEPAALVAERLRASIAATSIPDTEKRLSASVGVATWRRGESARELVERADRALRRAKTSGRNQVSRAESPETP